MGLNEGNNHLNSLNKQSNDVIISEDESTKEQVKILLEKGITGEYKFDDSFFNSVSEIQSKIAKSDLQNYLEDFSGNELNFEQLSVIINEDLTRFSDINELSSFLDAYDIKVPSMELFLLAKKGADNISFRGLLKDPKKITLDNLKYFQDIGLNFDELFKIFVSNGDKLLVNNFLDKLNNGNVDINLTVISKDALALFLNSPLVDKTKLSKFILDFLNRVILTQHLFELKKYIDLNGKNLFSSDLLQRINSTLDIKLDKFNPKNIIKSYLEGIDGDFSLGELSIKNSSSHRLWNTTFEESFDVRFNMIYRGKQDFFQDLNLDRFFNSNIHELSDFQRGKLYELVKEGGEYFERIKGYREYDSIVELLKKSYDKTK